jgi:hypothetical protein
VAETLATLSKYDWELFRVVNTQSIFSEFVRYHSIEEDGKQFRLWKEQIREINREDLHKKRFQGRFLGKSITCMDEFHRLCILYSGDEGTALLGTRAQPNIQPIFEKMVSMWERNHFLSFWINAGDRAVDRKNFEIRLKSNVTIKGRIQGKDGQGFNTVHPNIAAWIDEAQLLSEQAVAEFYGMISPQLPLLASGVPNGVRTSWAFQIDNDKDSDFAGGGMTRLDDPRMTPEFVEQLKKRYGGENSNLYRQKVLGEWGADSRMTFDIERIEHDLPDGKVPSYFRNIIIDQGTYSVEMLPALIPLREDMPERDDIWIAADHGGTGSPTTGYVHFFDKKQRCWRQYMRFLLYGLHVTPQVEIFNHLANALYRVYGIKPTIGLDTTGQGGQSVAYILEERGHSVVWADLNKKVKFGERLETEEEWRKRMEKDIWSGNTKQLVPVEMPLKQVAVPQGLIPNFYSGLIRVVNDTTEPSLWKQLGGTVDYEDAIGKYRKYETDYSYDGNPKYNHDFSAFEVFGAMIHRKEFNPGEPEVAEVWSEEIDVGWSTANAY